MNSSFLTSGPVIAPSNAVKEEVTSYSKIKQRINNNRTTALERTAAKATGGLNVFYWYQIFAA